MRTDRTTRVRKSFTNPGWFLLFCNESARPYPVVRSNRSNDREHGKPRRDVCSVKLSSNEMSKYRSINSRFRFAIISRDVILVRQPSAVALKNVIFVAAVSRTLGRVPFFASFRKTFRNFFAIFKTIVCFLRSRRRRVPRPFASIVSPRTPVNTVSL